MGLTMCNNFDIVHGDVMFFLSMQWDFMAVSTPFIVFSVKIDNPKWPHPINLTTLSFLFSKKLLEKARRKYYHHRDCNPQGLTMTNIFISPLWEEMVALMSTPPKFRPICHQGYVDKTFFNLKRKNACNYLKQS